MNLNMNFYQQVATIEWLSDCGQIPHPDLGFPVQWFGDRTVALQSMFSTQWADATTLAQGRLTGYLAKLDYNTYGTTWNKLATQSQALLEQCMGRRLSAAIDAGGWVASLAETPLPDITPAVRASIGKRIADLRASKAWDQCLALKTKVNMNRAALEITYRRKFPKAPVFFERLLRVYEAGRLPCGWQGDLEDWPKGILLAY